MFAYPALFTPEPEGGFTVTFRDLPEAVTWDEDKQRATAMARDALALALWRRCETGQELPPASAPQEGEEDVSVSPLHAIKLSLFVALQKQGIVKQELAQRLGLPVAHIDHLLDPDDASNLDTLERALVAVGRRLDVGVHKAA